MPTMHAPKNVVIVGGSMAGLLHGVQFKRQGCAVTILEQDPSSDRCSNQAGIGMGPSVVQFLEEHDLIGREVAIPASFTTIAWRTRPQLFNLNAPRKLTSWGLLYRVLRANFDGLESTAVPRPPPAREGDGLANYRAGQKVTELLYDKQQGLVDVKFADVTTGEEDSITADLVIGADGVRSTVRKLVQAPTEQEYAGYVAWRGTLPERLVSPETAQYFSNRVVSSIMKRSYMIVYIIPTDEGGLGASERLINWVWYYNVAEGSEEMASLFTATDGKVHQNTVPSGLVQLEVWKRQQAAFISQMSAPVAELISKTSNPFVTKVNEVLCNQGSHYDGHLVLVGDALATIRPHTAMATDQAARHSLSLAKVLRGEMTMETWDREAKVYGKRMILLSRVIGLLGQGTSPMFLKSLLVYIWFMIKGKLSKL